MSPGRARGRLPRGRGPGTPGALIFAGTAISAVAFAFCVIASACGWHCAVTGPGTAVSLVAMVACVLAGCLRGDGR